MLDQLLERRSSSNLRADGRKLIGYAVVFNQLSEDLGGFREIILPSAADRTLTEGVDVRALAHHRSDQVLGRTSANTLRLTKDDRGLLAEIDTPSTQVGADVLELVGRRDLSGMSFEFALVPGGERWERRDGQQVRIISDMLIREVSVVSWPAYPGTDVSVAQRSLQAAQDAERRASIAWLRMREQAGF